VTACASHVKSSNQYNHRLGSSDIVYTRSFATMLSFAGILTLEELAPGIYLIDNEIP
jgi:hypothetical protein